MIGCFFVVRYSEYTFNNLICLVVMWNKLFQKMLPERNGGSEYAFICVSLWAESFLVSGNKERLNERKKKNTLIPSFRNEGEILDLIQSHFLLK